MGKLDNVKAYINRVLKPYIISFGKKEFVQEKEKEYSAAVRRFREQLDKVQRMDRNFKNLLLVWGEPGEDDKKTVDMHETDKKASFGALLNTVFLLTPVLSTTFASVGNMLSLLDKPGEIGCLIVDEDGQASPHMALGAMFRCRRAIVVINRSNGIGFPNFVMGTIDAERSSRTGGFFCMVSLHKFVTKYMKL
ncbi:MAG: hypothetical protein J6I64_09585 [Lachnospiraceae bacterium]|nr:hypothetical protein [Lachnospiraceae bacterium]